MPDFFGFFVRELPGKLGILIHFIQSIEIFFFLADILSMGEKEAETAEITPFGEKKAAEGPGEEPEPQKAEEPEEKERQEPSFELVVSEDRLKAQLFAKSQGDPPFTVEDVNKFLKENRICFGLVGEPQIQQYIQTGILLQEPCLVAEGKPVEPGQDAQVIYHFERDPLKIGKLKEGGSIDFKEKGEIPQVEENAVLVEKIPLIRETPGTDVFGKSIPVAKAKDCALVSGPGTRRSPDGLKITSKIWGRPIATPDNSISVVPELNIQGDVGLKTGHIRFDGFVKVDGSIQEGFRVRAKKLAALEIFRGEVEIEGDILVDGGIIGAQVSAKGNIKARFIHSSQVSAVGDIVIEKEIIDSRIETGGNLFAIPSGKVFTSQVIAKKGIAADQIGSESSKPCALTIGVDNQSLEWIKKIREEISLKEKERAKIHFEVERLGVASKRLEEKIGKLDPIKEKALLEQSKIREGLESMPEGKDSSFPEAGRRRLRQIEETMKKVEGELQKLASERDQFANNMSLLQDQIKDFDGALQALQQEIERMTQDGSAKDVPRVKVHKEIFAGTTIEGLHCKLALNENFLKILAREHKISQVDTEGNESTVWEMKLSDLEVR